MRHFLRQTFAFHLALLFGSAAASADDAWPQFRGPQGNGIAADRKPGPIDFGPGKNEIWKTPMPPGFSSPCVWGERIFLTACDAPAKKLETLCLQRSDGRVLWRDAVAVETLEPIDKANNHASATPACDGERVYVYFGSYGLIAYQVDGKKAWEMRLPIPRVMFGSGTSPVIAGELVILNRLQAASFVGSGSAAKDKAPVESSPSEVLAVHRATGKVAWRTPIALPPQLGRSHATPAFFRSSAGDQLILAGGGRMTALEAATGKAIWWMDKLPAVATASPLVAGDRVFLNCTEAVGDVGRVTPPTFEEALAKWDKNKDGKLQRDELPDDLAVFTRYRADHVGDFSVKQWFFNRADTNHDGALSKEEWDRIFKETADLWLNMMKPTLVSVRLGGEGDISNSRVAWSSSKGVPEVPTLIAVGKRLYSVRNGGLVTCFNADSGKVQFEERLGASGSYYASPITDGEHIYFVSQPGVVTIIRASDKFERIDNIDLRDQVSATPALVGGRLYIRTDHHLLAFGAAQ